VNVTTVTLVNASQSAIVVNVVQGIKVVNVKMVKINKDMTFAELIQKLPEATSKLADRGLFCGGCPMAQLETIEDGAKAHGIDVDELVKELNNGK